MTGCMIRGMIKYRGYKGACVEVPFPVLPFGKDICHHPNWITLPKEEESSTSVIRDKQLPMRLRGNENITIINARNG